MGLGYSPKITYGVRAALLCTSSGSALESRVVQHFIDSPGVDKLELEASGSATGSSWLGHNSNNLGSWNTPVYMGPCSFLDRESCLSLCHWSSCMSSCIHCKSNRLRCSLEVAVATRQLLVQRHWFIYKTVVVIFENRVKLKERCVPIDI